MLNTGHDSTFDRYTRPLEFVTLRYRDPKQGLERNDKR